MHMFHQFFSSGSTSNNFQSTGGTVSINGKTYVGNTISVQNGVVMVDGKRASDAPGGTSFIFNVTITGAVEHMELTNGEVTVHGDVGRVKTVNGDVNVEQSVTGNVASVNGDIKIGGELNGDASTVHGDIKSAGKKMPGAVRKIRGKSDS